MAAAQRLTYTIEAYNVSHASENKIHDDSVAKKLGFSGGLVPGVEVFAYASHLPLERWGRAFLERGEMTARFGKPVYDGRIATATAVEGTDGRLEIRVESEGVECATATACLPSVSSPSPRLSDYAYKAPPDLSARPPADEASLAVGLDLSTVPAVLDRERHETYLREVDEAVRRSSAATTAPGAEKIGDAVPSRVAAPGPLPVPTTRQSLVPPVRQ
jgi:hypothetical protein